MDSLEQRRVPNSERLGRYELLTRIAAGGMAEVFVARVRGEGGFERLVAVKRMLASIAEDDHFAEMFLDEGRIAGLIESPHVVPILDVGRAENGELFIAMELVRGLALNSLLKLLAKGGKLIPVKIAVGILAQAAEGLSAAHEASSPIGEPLGIVHRDVSPQNLLVGIDGQVRIADFGVARAVHRRTSTSTGELKGKLAYFSPEQLRSKPATAQSDVFALGVVAWETLTSRRLFQGESPVDTIERIRTLTVPPIDRIRSDVPSGLVRAIERALQRDPTQRTPSAARFAVELREAIQPAPPATLAAFVKEWAGAEVAGLDERIRAALTRQNAATSLDITPPPSVEDRSGVRAADSSTDITPPQSLAPLESVTPAYLEPTVLHSLPGSVDAAATAGPVFAAEPPPTPSVGSPARWLIPLGLGSALVLALGAASLWWQRPEPELEVHLLPAHGPAVAATPIDTARPEAPEGAGSEAPPLVDVPAPAAEAEALAPEAPSVAPEAEARAPATPSRRSAGEARSPAPHPEHTTPAPERTTGHGLRGIDDFLGDVGDE